MPDPIRVAASLGSLALAQDWIYRFGALILPTVMSIFKRNGWIPSATYPLNRWTKSRPLLLFTSHFLEQYPPLIGGHAPSYPKPTI